MANGWWVMQIETNGHELLNLLCPAIRPENNKELFRFSLPISQTDLCLDAHIVVKLSLISGPKFTANHPFIYAIKSASASTHGHDSNPLILFVGHYSDRS